MIKSVRLALLATALMIASNTISSGEEQAAPLLPVEISPADPALHYQGRFDTGDKAAPRCEWPGCRITVRFTGTAINAKFSEAGDNFWQVEIDGKPTGKLQLQKGAHLYSLATGLHKGEHIVTLTRATEGFAGVTQFLGFQLDSGDSGAKLLPPAAVTRRIEVIGDSISCGYGVEAASEHEHFAPRTENAADAYGALTAARLGADYTCIAYSGRKMWPDNTIPELYDRTLTNDPALKWDFAAWTPDVVVINLGTNDFAHENPDAAGWIDAYCKFLARVRANYPKAAIYCTTGPMLGDDGQRNPRSTLLSYLQKIVEAEKTSGHPNIHLLDFGLQSRQNGLGADWHPSRKTQQLMADKLVETLQHDLGWK